MDDNIKLNFDMQSNTSFVFTQSNLFGGVLFENFKQNSQKASLLVLW